MYEVISAEAMDDGGTTPVHTAATPVPLSTEEFHRVRRRTWHHHQSTRCADACVDADPAATAYDVVVVVAPNSSGLNGLSHRIIAPDVASHHRSIDQPLLLNMNSSSRLFG